MRIIQIYISKKADWNKVLVHLRSVFMDLPIEELIKWGGALTYVFKVKNILDLAAFKK